MAQGDIEISANIKSNVGDLTKDVDKATDSTQKLTRETNRASGGFTGLSSAIRGIGTAIKTAGILVFVTVMAKLMEVFKTNQKVVDFFNTAMNSLGFAFNDLFKYVSENISNWKKWMKEMFEDPLPMIETIANRIVDRFITSLHSLNTFLVQVTKSMTALVELRFKDAVVEMDKAALALFDTLTGVEDSAGKLKETFTETADVVKDFVATTWESGQALTDLEKKARLAQTELAKLQAQRLKEAEDLRQIRDDETKTFAERISANSKLRNVIKQQQEDQLAAASAETKAAQAKLELDKDNIDFQIRYNEALVKEAEIIEATNAQLSEQKTNAVALDKELLAGQSEIRAAGQSGRERELEELKEGYRLQLELADKVGMDTKAINEQYARDKKMIIAEDVATQLGAYAQLGGALSTLAGDNKELAAAAAIIDTYAGANKAYALGGPVGFVTAAAIIVQGLANVKKIYSTDVGSGGGGGGGLGGGTIAEPPAPQMMSGAFQLEGGTQPAAMRAYVVTDEMTNSQNQLANIRRRATI